MKSFKVYRKNGQVVKVDADREGITPEGFLVFEDINQLDPNVRNVRTVFKEWEYYEVIPDKEEEALQVSAKQAIARVAELAQEQQK